MYDKFDLDKIDLSKEPSQEEPERQYYFMAKCRKWVREFERKNGHRPCFFTQTFGCQMNARDSEKLEGILSIIGFAKADSEEAADLVLYNTCTVREHANLKVYGRLGYLKTIKKKNPHMLIALCGCMMQEETVVEKIKKSYRFVDLVFGTHNLYKFAELLYNRISSGKITIDIWQDTDKIVEELPADRKYFFMTAIPLWKNSCRTAGSAKLHAPKPTTFSPVVCSPWGPSQAIPQPPPRTDVSLSVPPPPTARL